MAAVTGRLPRPPSSPCTGHPVGTGDTVSRGRPGPLSFKERPQERMGPEPRKGTSSREQTGQCGCYPAGRRFYSDAADGAGAAVAARRLDSLLPVKDPPGSSHQVPPGCPSAADPVGSGAPGRTAVTVAFILSAGESGCSRGPRTAGRLRGAVPWPVPRGRERRPGTSRASSVWLSLTLNRRNLELANPGDPTFSSARLFLFNLWQRAEGEGRFPSRKRKKARAPSRLLPTSPEAPGS